MLVHVLPATLAVLCAGGTSFRPSDKYEPDPPAKTGRQRRGNPPGIATNLPADARAPNRDGDLPLLELRAALRALEARLRLAYPQVVVRVRVHGDVGLRDGDGGGLARRRRAGAVCGLGW